MINKQNMKFSIVSKDKEKISEVKKLLKKYNLKLSSKKPDFVLSVGGDGTLLIAEHKYPQITKIPIKNSSTCIKCENISIENVLKKIIRKEYYIEEFPKLEIIVENNKKKRKMTCMNDFILRNSNVSRAIRFSLTINHEKIHELIIGDGLVISTPFGSTAYFKNITRKTFKQGFGLAYNNTNIEKKMLKLKEKDVIEIELIRGPADVSADHQKHPKVLEEKSKIIVKKSSEKVRIIKLK